MRIIQFKENQKEIWNRFIAENSSESFLQAWEWGSFQDSLGRKIWRLAIMDDNENENEKKKLEIGNWKLENLLLIALVVKYDLPFGKSYLYCPRMMEIGNWKLEIMKFLFEEIRKIAEKENSLFLRFDPAMEMEEKSSMPLFEKGGIIPPLKKGARGIFRKAPNEIQPRNTLILDLTKSEEELLKEMKPKTRYNIRLAGRKEVRIKYYVLGIDNRELEIMNKESFREKFKEFWKLMKETARRDNFRSHNKNYYWQMLENLGSIENPPLTLPKRGIISNPSQEENNLHAKLYLAEHNKKIIAANIVLFFGDYCVYLHGASSSKYRNLMAPYLLQWRQILDAKKMGCKKYDFWGVSPANKDTVEPPPAPSLLRRGKNNWGGITRFKKGFGGEERNYVGAYNLIFDKFWYGVYRIIKKAKIIFNF